MTEIAINSIKLVETIEVKDYLYSILEKIFYIMKSCRFYEIQMLHNCQQNEKKRSSKSLENGFT